MRKSALLFVLGAVPLFCTCFFKTKSSGPDIPAVETASNDSFVQQELPLPEVPADLTDPVKRADYIMEHYWDRLDICDTLRSHNRMYMEQNVVNFISLFPHGRKQELPSFIGNLLKRAETDSTAFSIVTDVMERYLDDPNSPMRNEEYYILFLEEYLRLPGLSEYDRMRPAYQLEMAKKNRPGAIAADFAYIDRNGGKRTLHSTSGKRIMLLFYDPECDHCSAILQQLYESSLLRELIDRKKLIVLAIYTEGNRELWNETKDSMPQEWYVGMDADGIFEHEIYALPAMPIIYLLDKDKTVLLKDTNQSTLEDYLSKTLDEN